LIAPFVEAALSWCDDAVFHAHRFIILSSRWPFEVRATLAMGLQSRHLGRNHKSADAWQMENNGLTPMTATVEAMMSTRTSTRPVGVLCDASSWLGLKRYAHPHPNPTKSSGNGTVLTSTTQVQLSERRSRWSMRSSTQTRDHMEATYTDPCVGASRYRTELTHGSRDSDGGVSRRRLKSHASGVVLIACFNVG
jgi:hypothetical protein